MLKKTLRKLSPIIIMMALLLSACGAVTIKDEAEATAEFQTAVAAAVAQTAEAQVTPLTATSEATQTYIPSETPIPTITETPSLTPIPPTSIADTFCDNSAFIADVTIPDHTLLAPGQTFEKTWTMKNTGTCIWKPGYTIVFSSGAAMKGNTRAINQSVAPGEQIDVTVKLIAPNTPGDYAGVWRLANGKAQPFGAYVSVVITVAGAGTTVPTPEAATPVATPTP
jgi:hypothetical protein